MIRRTTSADPDFLQLVSRLDADLAERDGSDHAYYAQFNHVEALQHCIVLFEHNLPVACGAVKPFGQDAMEVKRMYTLPEARGNGHARRVLTELESWARETGSKRCVLETGKRQPEAIALYKKAGYARTENYGQYIGVENSVCFQKTL